MQVGVVSEVWRYPVKSMGGERLERAEIGPRGVAGDRGWAVRDEAAGEIRGAKKLAGLLQCRAAYREEPLGDAIPHVDMTLPDGSIIGSDDPAAGKALSGFLGREVTLCSRRPAGDLDHYRRGALDHADLADEIREIFGLEPEEPLVDLSLFPPEILEFTSPPGTYFDAFPLHALTTASLDALAVLVPRAVIDVRRFRPNVLVETETSLTGLVETGWTGHDLLLGAAVAHVEGPAIRCVMPTRTQPGLPEDRSLMRAMVRETAQCLGVYATVSGFGHVRRGDPVELV